MQTTPAFLGLECTESGELYGATERGRAPETDAPLDPAYDYDALDVDRGTLAGDGPGMWAYEALLPFPSDVAVTAGEGATPLVEADRLAGELGVGRVVVKDEARNPTGTVLDRGMSLAATAAKQHAEADDVEPLAHASPGNGGQSAAAYVGRLDLRSYAFVPSRSAFSNKAMINVHGGQMRVVGGRYPQALEAVDDQLATDYYSLQEFTTPYRHEGAKTLAFELLADLDWELPDGVFVPCGTGEVVVGLVKGLRELRELGLVEELPPVYAVQAAGCAPVAAAFERGADEPEPWATPDTIVGELEIPDPAGGALAVEAVRETGGEALAVEDSDILESAVAVAQSEVVEMGVAGGASAAGAWDRAAEFDDDATLALVNTESGLKTPDLLRSHLMGKGV